MRTTRFAASTYASLDALPASCELLFEPADNGDFFATRAWYATVLAAALPHGAAPCFALAPGGVALLPLQTQDHGQVLLSLTTPYTCLHRPLIAAVSADEIEAAGRSFGLLFRRWNTVRIDALPAAEDRIEALLRGMRAVGMLPVRFDHFVNWHEPVAGITWADYLAGRSGALRETIRRKVKKAERDPDLRFDLVLNESGIEEAIAAYESVYARSWKEPEPFPEFNACLMRAAVAAGVLRLGTLRYRDLPIAVQFWIVTGGTASVLKLAHDEAFKAHSPGTVLTALMIRHLLDDEHVRELDFGRGDDPYKRLWASARRQRIGVVLANPRRFGGAAFMARHYAGRLVHLARGRRR